MDDIFRRLMREVEVPQGTFCDCPDCLHARLGPPSDSRFSVTDNPKSVKPDHDWQAEFRGVPPGYRIAPRDPADHFRASDDPKRHVLRLERDF